ncbi:PEP-CTERM sorting domain-containing protein [Emcibacter sp.]|uniref:PEP-CTERM sorting domain-containing protein n=1 Tax=Emcibacter sp. TaxID=1979954 RepID=UPI002AA8A424|nr:PEP-CTERM sorting domain-containing protein [Emcibacter sp.]
MKKLGIILTTLAAVLFASSAYAVTVQYNFAGLQDIDTDFETFANGNVADSGTILDVNVSFQVTPDYADDISVWLNHNGTSVLLIPATEEDVSDSYYDALMDDESNNILPETGTVDGTFRPLQNLSAFDGMNANGLWSLSFLDTYEPFSEFNDLLGWSLYITYDDDFVTADVPEPAALGLLGFGLAGFGLARRRRG